METEKLQVNLNTAGETILRIGDALPVKPPRKVAIVGNIDAPGIWFRERVLPFPELKAKSHVHATITEEAATVLLVVNEKDDDATEITGKLAFNNMLKEFQINFPGHRWEVDALIKFLRIRRHFFQTVGEHSTLMESLSNFRGKAFIEFEQKRETTGNRRDLKDVALTQNLPSGFSIRMPLFAGGPYVVFRVDIGADFTDAGVKLYLFSDELEQLKYDLIREEVEREIAPMRNFGLPVTTNG